MDGKAPAVSEGEELEAIGLTARELELLTRHSPYTVMVVGLDGRIVFVSRTAPGLSVDAVLGKRVYDFVPADQHAQMRECFDNVVSTRAPDVYENLFTGPDGSISYWESRAGPILTEEVVVGFVVHSADVTKQRGPGDQLDRFFNLSLDMLCVASMEGVFLRTNPAMEHVLGWSADQLASRPFIDFIHPDDRDQTRAEFEACVAGRAVTDFENRYRCRDGGYRTLQWRAVLDMPRKVVVAVARDTTETRSLQARVFRAQKMDAVGQLAGGIAHDFNNLLLSILANTEFALEELEHLEATETIEYVRDIEAAAERATALTKQLLAFSRQQPILPAPLDLNRVVTELMGVLRSIVPANIVIGFVQNPSIALIDGDRGQIEQVLMNLSINARDAMPDGGELQISLASSDSSNAGLQFVELTVADSGTGMAPDVVQRAFEPFFTTKDPGKGTGLGLATVYGIVEQHHGTINIDSELGTGTTICVGFPASATQGATRARVATILVAEDERLVRTSVVRMLTRAGFEVVVAADGHEAVELFERAPQSIDLALLDVVMPRLSGPEALERMHRIRPDLAAVFTSGYSGNAELGRPILRKPYRREDLLDRILQHLPEAAVLPDSK